MNLDVKNKVDNLLNTSYELSFSDIFNRATDLYKGIAILGGLGTLIYIIVSIIISQISQTLLLGDFNDGIDGIMDSYPNIDFNEVLALYQNPNMLANQLVSVLLSATLMPILYGIYKLCLNYHRNQTVDFLDIFSYYKQPYFGKLFLYSIIYSILITIATVLCFLPAIYLGVAWIIAVPFIVFAKASPWEALEASRKIITKQWVNTFLIVLALIGINIAGLLLCCVGLLASIPFSFCVIYILYDDVIGVNEENNEIDEIGVSI